MKKTVIILGLTLMLACLNSVASAEYFSREFGDMDANHDDYVDFDEYRYYIPEATVDEFKKIDTSKDKKIDFFEWVAYQESREPFESKRSFTYRGQSGIWHVDSHGNRYHEAYGSYYRPWCGYWSDYRYNYRRDYGYDPWYDPWYRHRFGYYWGH